jgi:hypothetical protein
MTVMKRLFLLAISLVLLLASCVTTTTDSAVAETPVPIIATPSPSANPDTLIKATILSKLNLIADPNEQPDTASYLAAPLVKLDCAVMLVRVFGIDIAAADSAAFDDVGAESQAAASFVVRNGLMEAGGSTAFGAQEALSVGQLAVAMLRFLGYEAADASQAGQTALSLNLLSAEQAAALDEGCTIGDFIDISYRALFVPLSGKYTCLFDDLAAKNIITNEEMHNLSEEELNLIAADMDAASVNNSGME